MGNGEWGMGNGEWGMGNGEWGIACGLLLIVYWLLVGVNTQFLCPMPYAPFPITSLEII